MIDIAAFVRESNAIEGIYRRAYPDEVEAHQEFLRAPEVTLSHIEALAWYLAAAKLRTKPGMDVRVGRHVPLPGGAHIADRLRTLLLKINARDITMYDAHVAYETLHPFMDGNGRTGRALWLWMMQRDGHKVAPLGFLHTFYYQTLQGSR